MVMGVCLRRFCFNMSVDGDICLFLVGPGYDGLLLRVLFRFCLLSSFLSRCGSPSDTRWCNTSKELYILNRCWSQTSYYGAAHLVQSWVKFAYVC